MKALLQLFATVVPGEGQKALLPAPQDFNSGELHAISMALTEWNRMNPALQVARSAQFKIDTVRAAWARVVKERM